MRKLFLILGLITVAVSHVVGESPPTTSDATANVEQSILQLTRDWLAAEETADRATLRRIIADDFQGTAPGGNIVLKEEVIPEEGSTGGLKITSSNLKARIFGDTAVVTGRGVSKIAERGELRFTLVFAKRDNRWQMVAGHLSAVPSP